MRIAETKTLRLDVEFGRVRIMCTRKPASDFLGVTPLPRPVGLILALAAIVSSLSAAPAVPVLSVPARAGILQGSVPVPVGVSLDSRKRWQLLEMGGSSDPIGVEVLPGPGADGRALESQQVLAVSIPPPAGQEARRFQLLARPGAAPEVEAAFRWSDVNESSLGLWEGKRPVLVYNHGTLSKPGVPSHRNRSTYIHPIYGLDGEVLTDDFPEDHYHHRGLFWAWPHVRVEGKNFDLWDIRGIHQRFERWIERQAGSAAAVLAVENGWYIGDRKVMQERVWVTVFPATAEGQVLDVELTWVPAGQPVTLAGAEDKSYGGLTLRFAPRTGTVITTPRGSKAEDLAMTRLPWADLSAQFAGAPRPSGATLFIDASHPDYPPTWLTRHYGVLCVGWPGVTPETFSPGQRIHCRYRVWLHRGAATAAQLSRAYEDYQSTRALSWK